MREYLITTYFDQNLFFILDPEDQDLKHFRVQYPFLKPNALVKAVHEHEGVYDKDDNLVDAVEVMRQYVVAAQDYVATLEAAEDQTS